MGLFPLSEPILVLRGKSRVSTDQQLADCAYSVSQMKRRCIYRHGAQLLFINGLPATIQCLVLTSMGGSDTDCMGGLYRCIVACAHLRKGTGGFVCLLLLDIIATVFQLYHTSDMMYEMRRNKPKPTLLLTQGSFNLLDHIGMV